MTTEKKKARKSISKNRRRTFATGLNVCISVFLAATLLVLINYLSNNHYSRKDLSWRKYYQLSDKTKDLLASLKGDFKVIAFFKQESDMLDDTKKLLKEYEYEAGKHKELNLLIQIVDPDRDIAKIKELKQKYGISNPNIIVFEAEGRTKYIEAEDMAEYDISIHGTDLVKKKLSFNGEQAISSAIQSVSQNTRPVVYFLRGHGECDINDFTKLSGYSRLATTIRRDNIELKELLLTQHSEIPEDCSALVIAGPDRKLSNTEIGVLSEYLNKNGRILLLIDPEVKTGLNTLLNNWGVRLSSGTAVGLTRTGRELVVEKYGEHPITANFRNMITMFFRPRVLEPIETNENNINAQVDKPRVSILAANTANGWLETNINQDPPKYEPGVDIPGPVAVAVAIEKGPVSGIDVEIKPTRIVVVGDSYFVSNDTIKTGIGGNIDFFMTSLNWLLEREMLMSIAPRIPSQIHLGMNRKQKKIANTVIIGLLPGLIALIGLMVWWQRRK